MRGLRLTQQPGEPSSSASLSASGGAWSGYLPVKLQDLTQVGQNAGELFATGLRGWLQHPIAALHMSLTLAALPARSSCRSGTEWALRAGCWLALNVVGQIWTWEAPNKFSREMLLTSAEGVSAL